MSAARFLFFRTYQILMEKCTDEKHNYRCDVSAVSHFDDWYVQMSNAPPGKSYKWLLLDHGVPTKSKNRQRGMSEPNFERFFLCFEIVWLQDSHDKILI